MQIIMQFVFYIFFFVFSFAAFADIHTDSVCEDHQCMIVIDAGSGGSRLYLYTYDKKNTQPSSDIHLVYSNKVTPGLSTLHATEVNQYMTQLFKGVTAAHDQALPVYVYATAGMRLLDEHHQKELYVAVEQWFHQHPQWSLKEARTISGVEEGVFAWVSMNEQLGAFSQPLKSNLPGIVEIGGASVQVVFPVSSVEKGNVLLTIANQSYQLSVHSFLGLGINEIPKKLPKDSSCFPFSQGDGYLCHEALQKVLNEIHLEIKSPATQWYAAGAIGSLLEKKPLAIENEISFEQLFEKVHQTYCQPAWLLQKELYSDDLYLENNCLLGTLFYSLMKDMYHLDTKKAMLQWSTDSMEGWTRAVVLLTSAAQ